ncbi:MAG: hypothetical protein GX554_03295, partial [Elusimicrobia bacterium]|nr:hypothetical protein [Elusimicrobiota bacterium]
ICAAKKVEIAGYIPFSKKVSESIVQTIPYAELHNDIVSESIKNIWNRTIT